MYGWQLSDYADSVVKQRAASAHVEAAWEHYQECCKAEQEAAEATDLLYRELVEQITQEAEAREGFEQRISDEIKRAEEAWANGYQYGKLEGHRNGMQDAYTAIANAASQVAEVGVKEQADPELERLLAEEEAIEQRYRSDMGGTANA